MLPYAPWLCWIFPITGALFTPLFAKISHRLRDYAAVAFSFFAVIAVLSMLPDFFTGVVFEEKIIKWVVAPGLKPIELGILVDPLSILLANVVAVISFLIMVYSLGYMHGDPGLTRYWFFMNFFIGNMLLLVFSNNFIQLLIGWEGVGLCSYALIGYYYRNEPDRWVGGPKPTPVFSPTHCGMKAFIMTGVGDSCLLAAVFIIYISAGTLNFMELYETAPTWMKALSGTPGLLTLTSILLLGGPIGKSAQFPLHEWLPEAMAGPTSVSALIHAATMVKAGVYLIARVLPIFYYGYWIGGFAEAYAFFLVIAWIGAFTAFMAATQGMVTLELKKVLAYSTISQIGYMTSAMGIAGLAGGVLAIAYMAGLFHLMSHSIFKAALFLCAGAVIHACGAKFLHEMGGMRKMMPLTFIFMLIAALSLMGLPPFSGFWSKDAILVSALEAGEYALFAMLVITATLTAFYSVRFISMTFLGAKSGYLEERERKGIHVHEVPPVMWVPYALLAFFAITLGLIGPIAEKSLHEIFEGFLHGVFHLPSKEANGISVVHIIVPVTSLIAIAVGGGIAYAIYVAKKIDQKRLIAEHKILGTIYTFFWNRWFMNPTYYRIFVNGTLKLSSGTFGAVELGIMDKISIAVGKVTVCLSSLMKKAIEAGIMSKINVAAGIMIIYLSDLTRKVIETEIMDKINVIIAMRIISACNRLRKIQTGVLSYNITYIVIALIVLLIVLCLLAI